VIGGNKLHHSRLHVELCQPTEGGFKSICFEASASSVNEFSHGSNRVRSSSFESISPNSRPRAAVWNQDCIVWITTAVPTSSTRRLPLVMSTN
jgi:hypothetical protein